MKTYILYHGNCPDGTGAALAAWLKFGVDRDDGSRQWGLRSRPDFDCSVIAKAMGGGGHKCAAGFVE